MGVIKEIFEKQEEETEVNDLREQIADGVDNEDY